MTTTLVFGNQIAISHTERKQARMIQVQQRRRAHALTTPPPTTTMLFLMILVVSCEGRFRAQTDVAGWTGGARRSLLTSTNQQSLQQQKVLWKPWGITTGRIQSELHHSSSSSNLLWANMRGGAIQDDDDEEEEDSEEEDEYEVEEEEEEEEYEEEEETTSVTAYKASSVAATGNEVAQYDEMLVPSPFLSLFVSLGVMLLSRKIDLFQPMVVLFARFAFAAYIILVQLFVVFVRFRAKAINDETPIELKSPLSSALGAGLGDSSAAAPGGGMGMLKNLASSFLASQTTIVEYDVKEASSMQKGMLINMVFQWFLHFKMQQVQPLLIQTASGVLNLVYSPLFQVYVMGRNLERPFKNPTMQRVEAQQDALAEQAGEVEGESETEQVEPVVDKKPATSKKANAAKATKAKKKVTPKKVEVEEEELGEEDAEDDEDGDDDDEEKEASNDDDDGDEDSDEVDEDDDDETDDSDDE